MIIVMGTIDNQLYNELPQGIMGTKINDLFRYEQRHSILQ